ncbi:MAG: hypothetical protein ACE5QV_07725, partial [Fidelibacterota bacterium]
MEIVKEVFVVIENKPGTLGDLCGQLARKKINIEAVGVFQDTAKLVVSKTGEAVKLLKDLKYEVEVREVLKADLENKPGELAFVTSKIGSAGINIEYCYGTMSRHQNE